MTVIEITAAFDAVLDALIAAYAWAQNVGILVRVGDRSFTISFLSIALGLAVIYIILNNLPIWGENDDE